MIGRDQCSSSSSLLLVLAALTGLGLALGACRESPTSQPLEASITGTACDAGTDPNPTASGVYLGGCDPQGCFQSDWADTDQDDMADLCESVLASTFAPELAMCDCDGGTGREPHWVAMPLGPTSVRIGYLLSYYNDWGSPHLDCYIVDMCHSHPGDSENIFLDIAYDPTTQHWVLQTAHYSAHESYNFYGPGPNGYPDDLQWPTNHPGSYPRAFVSINKHANYASQPECEAAVYGFEDCNGNVHERVAAGSNLNLGSSSVPLLDCMPSSIYQGSVIECYWSYNSTFPNKFSGWTGSATTDAAYPPKLAAMGFFPTGYTVGINGPTMMRPDVVCTWSATAQGGTPPYTYDWTEHNYNGHFSETTEGTSYAQFGGGDTGTSIDVTITDAVGTQTTGGGAGAQVDENLPSNCQ